MQNLKLQNRSGGCCPEYSLDQAPQAPHQALKTPSTGPSVELSLKPKAFGGLVDLKLKQPDRVGSYLRPLEGVAGL